MNPLRESVAQAKEIAGPNPCQWFALCENAATTTRSGPGPEPGMRREIPICDRCNDRIERLEA